MIDLAVLASQQAETLLRNFGQEVTWISLLVGYPQTMIVVVDSESFSADTELRVNYRYDRISLFCRSSENVQIADTFFLKGKKFLVVDIAEESALKRLYLEERDESEIAVPAVSATIGGENYNTLYLTFNIQF